jgi:hypothetical protein
MDVDAAGDFGCGNYALDFGGVFEGVLEPGVLNLLVVVEVDRFGKVIGLSRSVEIEFDFGSLRGFE